MNKKLIVKIMKEAKSKYIQVNNKIVKFSIKTYKKTRKFCQIYDRINSTISIILFYVYS